MTATSKFRAEGLEADGKLWDLYQDGRRIEVEIDLEDLPIVAKRHGGQRGDIINVTAYDGYRSRVRIP